jgi:predicted acyl esterase
MGEAGYGIISIALRRTAAVHSFTPEAGDVTPLSILREARRLVFTREWSTSERKYDVTVERDVKVRIPDGTLLDGDIYRPASSERFPVILGAHAYNKEQQSTTRRL